MAEATRSPPARTPALQAIASAGMELSWLYAVFALLSELLGLPLFPPSVAAALFVASIAGAAITRGRGWRRYTVAAVYAGLLLPAVLVAPTALAPWLEPGHTLADLAFVLSAASTADPAAWMTPVVLLAGCVAFWWSGLALSRRAVSGAVASARFDIGICVLGFAVAIGWAAGTTGSAMRRLIPAFFLFGVLAVALTRANGTGTRSFPVGFRGAGIASSFALVVSILTCGAQTNSDYTTNWVAAPSNWRMVSNRICDVNTLPGWRTVTLARDAACGFAEPHPAPGGAGLFHAWQNRDMRIEILNFPYNPKDFRVVADRFEPLRPVATISWRVLPVQGRTNWGPGGKAGSVFLQYDYGQPVSRPVPVLVPRKAKR